MKIALAILHADPARGGAERYTVDLAAALAAAGEQVTLVSASAAPVIPRGVESVVLGDTGSTRLRKYLRFIDRLDALRRDRHFDILHAMLPVRACDVYHPHAGLAADAVARGHLTKSAPFGRLAARLGNHFNARRQAFARVERALLQTPNRPVVLGLSNYVNSTVRVHFPDLAENRLVRLFNAVDLSRFDPDAEPGDRSRIREQFAIPAEAVVLLMMAQDFARKGLAETLTALAAAGVPHTHLLVVGRPDPTAYATMARRLGIAARVHFAGPTSTPAAFYRAADAYILPTRHDPCSLAVLEALCMGLPVISTIFNGATEAMTHDIHGYILDDPADISTLSQSISRISNDSGRKVMASACRLLGGRLSYEAHLQHLQEFYGTLTSPAVGAANVPRYS